MKNPYLTSASDIENLITFTGSPGNVRNARHSGLSAPLLRDALRCAKPSTRRMKSSDPVAISIKQLLDTKTQDKRGKNVSKYFSLVSLISLLFNYFITGLVEITFTATII